MELHSPHQNPIVPPAHPPWWHQSRAVNPAAGLGRWQSQGPAPSTHKMPEHTPLTFLPKQGGEPSPGEPHTHSNRSPLQDGSLTGISTGPALCGAAWSCGTVCSHCRNSTWPYPALPVLCLARSIRHWYSPSFGCKRLSAPPHPCCLEEALCSGTEPAAWVITDA